MKTDKDANDILSSLSIACMYWAIPLGLIDTVSWGKDDSFASLNEQIRSIQPINPSVLERAMRGE